MLQQLKAVVTKTDGTSTEYPITPKTVVAFERNFKTGLGVAFSNEQKIEHVYWLAWDAERTAGNVVPLFDKWLEDILHADIKSESGPLDVTA